ncbi:MAG: hypothetical protein Q8J76_07790, partial [Desulfobulbaceae bacterium]|nr:hypothetical protein [Desulfobulbaceae bacterium]
VHWRQSQMKWKSPFLSDLRNKLGESIVGSMWKGRPYFRSYVVPSNPKTNGQKAHRDVMTKAVANWQVIVTGVQGALNETEWNRVALPDAISGFNKFTKDFVGTEIAPGKLVATVFTKDYNVADVTHIGGGALKIPRNELRIGVYRGGQMLPYTVAAVLDTAPKWYVTVAGMLNYAEAAYTPTDGDILYAIDNRVFPASIVEAEQLAQATSHYTANEATGVADEATIVA